MSSFKLITVNQTKINKGQKYGYVTGILHLAPNNVAKMGNVCKNSSPGCRAICINYTGRGRYNKIQQARIRKTKLFFENKELFLNLIEKDLRALIRLSKRLNKKPCVRLDGTSDLGLAIDIADQFPGIIFYDYTKDPQRYAAFLNKELPKNYHLTFSRSETNDVISEKFLKQGGSVAYIFAKEIPREFKGYEVINGDRSDLRFKDRHWFKQKFGFIVGLRQKTTKNKKHKGFVIYGN